MDRFPYDAEARENRVIELIDARIHAIRHDIRVNRASTVAAVVDRLDLGNFEGDARDILRAAVVGHSAAVGVDHAAAVEAAIYFEAEALAERDIADMERRRAESARENRIEQRVWNHFFARSAA
jgi:RNA:NAD 2'-phosphotransferase (TPT1/KptA family)